MLEMSAGRLAAEHEQHDYAAIAVIYLIGAIL